MRLVTDAVVRAPSLWRVLRRVVVVNFDRLAPEWEATRVDETRLRPAAAALDAVPGAPGSVLDVGTGTGAVARLASARWPAAAVTGVDVSPGMVAQARCLAASPHESYVVADASRLPFADASFDLVTLNNVIPFFDELVRVTAPGGYIAISYSLGDRTPIYVAPTRSRAELERRGCRVEAELSTGPGVAIVARRSGRP